MLKGRGVSNGIGIGKALIIEEKKFDINDKKIEDVEEEVSRFTNSLNKTNTDTNIEFVILMVTMSAVGAVNVLIKKQRKGRKSAKKSKSQG